MDPVQALEEIASLLEVQLASPFKAKAFRRAAGVIGPLDDDELRARAADGRLKRTPGIGDSSLGVIVEALDGKVPGYLADLREKAGVETATGLRALLRGDLHAHSDWSDGTTSIAAMARAAASAGLEYFALTDHSPTLRVANGLSPERLESQLEIVGALNAGLGEPDRDDAGDARDRGDLGVRILTGIEVDILEDGVLDQRPDLLDRLDVVVASVHSKLRAPRDVMTKRMLRAIRDPRMNVLGHCTGRLVQGSRGTRPQSEFDAEAVFAACAEHDVAVEINSRPERQDPPDDLIAIAIEAGCRFSIDTDGHAPGHFGFLALGAARAEAAGIPPERIVTTWDAERLVDWAGSKKRVAP
ncbi:PHP domain-containing protein [Agromyces binzhouensis]|uniref:PHP domain-containing protein n=1 Tax=Agromyces binzhouensis TaxID=1817495 RepID=A0A4Q2J5F0_9MICO|nr:PHP domain-containing protein [Agromyces binzhouensis]RXZ41173.1 PHP domain-containing protein [Agromyces binzhouensis]